MSAQPTASQTSDLIAILGETDYASASLEQQSRYITNLESELEKLDQHIQNPDTMNSAAAPDIQQPQDSALKRFAQKITKKDDTTPANTTADGDANSTSAVSAEQTQSVRDAVASMIKDAKKRKDNLQADVDRHKETQKKFDALNGSTSDDPKIQQTSSQYHDLATKVAVEIQTMQILGQAKAKMDAARFGMESAREHQDMNQQMLNHAFEMERTSVSNAQKAVLEAEVLVSQAQRINPNVNMIVRLDTGQETGITHVMHQVLSGLGFRDKLKALLDHVILCMDQIGNEENKAKHRLDGLQQDALKTGKQLNHERAAVQKAKE